MKLFMKWKKKTLVQGYTTLFVCEDNEIVVNAGSVMIKNLKLSSEKELQEFAKALSLAWKEKADLAALSTTSS